MDVKDTVKELFEPTFEAIGDSDLDYSQKRELLYNLYCFACAIYPDYAGQPANTLFEYGCCFLIEPERHPDYAPDDASFVHTSASADTLPKGGRWYLRRGMYFVKYDYGSELYGRLVSANVIPEQDRKPIAQISLYAAVYISCKLDKSLLPLWYSYYFYLDATNEPVDERFDGELDTLLHDEKVYAGALEVKGSMLIGDEAELDGALKLLRWYKPFMDYRREHIADVLEKRMTKKDFEFVCEYSRAMLSYYPENASLMNWYAASATERIIRDRDGAALPGLINDLKDFLTVAPDMPTIKKYLALAEAMNKNIK